MAIEQTLKYSVYDFKAKTAEGQELAMSEFKGKAVLIENVSAK